MKARKITVVLTELEASELQLSAFIQLEGAEDALTGKNRAALRRAYEKICNGIFSN